MPNEETVLEDQSALYSGPIKLASAKAKQVLPEDQTTRNSYDLDPNLDFKMKIEKSRTRILAAHGKGEEKYVFSEYPKQVSKQDKDSKRVIAIVNSKEDEDHFHGNQELTGSDASDSWRHDIHGNEVVRLVPAGLAPDVVKVPMTTVYTAPLADHDYPKPPADYTADELKAMQPAEVPDYPNLPSADIPEAAKPKE